jgi:hypothetical protein
MTRSSIEKFLPAYLEAAKNGMTREEFAESFGIKPATVYQRVYELRRATGEDIPLLSAGGTASVTDRAKAILASFQNSSASAPAKKSKKAAANKPVVEETSEEIEGDADFDETDSALTDIFG